MRSKLIVGLLVSIVLLFIMWSYRGEAATETVTSYEYQVMFNSATSPNLRQLNEFGAQGWELVGVTESGGQIVLYIKRVRKSG